MDISQVGIEKKVYDAPLQKGKDIKFGKVQLNKYQEYDTPWFKELASPAISYTGPDFIDWDLFS